MKFDSLILAGIGSPHQANIADCEKFLREFLSDKEVLNLPFFVRHFLARCIAKKRAPHYAQKLKLCDSLGTKTFDFYMKSLSQKLEDELRIKVVWASTYGDSSIEKAVEKLVKTRADKNVLFLPLFPQKASSTTFSPILKFRKASRKISGKYRIIEGYHKNPCYLSNIANSIKKLNSQDVVLSFHSIPISQLKSYDYESDCRETLFELQKILPTKNLSLAWQSVMKIGKWLNPKIEDVALQKIKQGQKNLGAICAGFFCECLETSLEINTDLRKLFLANGGETFEYAPCLNDSDSQVEIIKDIILRQY